MLNFSSKEEKEIAETLGYRQPTPSPDRTVETTNVVGYMNGNLWPVAFTINELGGIAIQLRNRGDYVTVPGGVKANDPILEKFCGPGMLSRELSRTGPVKVVRFSTPAALPPSFGNGVTTSSVVPKDGQVYRPAPAVPAPSASHSSVMAMDIESAKRLKLVRPTRLVAEPSVVDSGGAPLRGDQIPDLDGQTAEDVGPSSRPAPVLIQASTPENDEQTTMVRSLLAAAGKPRPDDAYRDGDVFVVSKVVDKRGEPPLMNLPQPDLTESSPVPELLAKHACKVCGKGFEFASLLKRHLIQKHTSSSGSLLAEHGLA